MKILTVSVTAEKGENEKKFNGTIKFTGANKALKTFVWFCTNPATDDSKITLMIGPKPYFEFDGKLTDEKCSKLKEEPLVLALYGCETINETIDYVKEISQESMEVEIMKPFEILDEMFENFFTTKVLT